jgi:hypothetical protein
MQEMATISFKVAGKPYAVDYGRLTGIDFRDFELAVGKPLMAAGTGASEGLIFFAGLKWLTDRKSNPKLTFEEVLGAITYSDLELDDVSEAPPDPPTPEGDSQRVSLPSPTSTGSSPGKLSS